MSIKLQDITTVATTSGGFASYVTTPSYAKACFKALRDVMGLKDGILYPKYHIFIDDHLLELTPEDIVNLFKNKEFGTTEPDADTVPSHRRSSSLENYKKQISY